MSSMHKDAFDAALQPGFRERTAAVYRALNEAQNDDAETRLEGTVRERPCPLCGTDRISALLHRKHGLELVRCADCPMIYSRVILTEDAEQAFYGASAFQDAYLALKRNDAYADLERRKCAYLIQEAKQVAPHARTFLEVGCGAGRLLEAAREAGWHTLGVEPNPGFAAEARRRELHVLDGWFPQSPSPEHGHFDVIALLDVVEHAADPVRLLTQARLRLNPGGVMLVQVPNFHSLLVQLQGEASAVICQGHWNYFTAPALLACAERAALKAVRIETLLTELDRIEEHPPEQIRATARRLAGNAMVPERLSPSWLHEHRLGFKLFGMFTG